MKNKRINALTCNVLLYPDLSSLLLAFVLSSHTTVMSKRKISEKLGKRKKKDSIELSKPCRIAKYMKK